MNTRWTRIRDLFWSVAAFAAGWISASTVVEFVMNVSGRPDRGSRPTVESAAPQCTCTCCRRSDNIPNAPTFAEQPPKWSEGSTGQEGGG